MKKLFKIILGATVGSTLLLSSCNFLDVDPYFEATFKEDSIFHSKKNAEGYLWNTPKGFSRRRGYLGKFLESGGICFGRNNT